MAYAPFRARLLCLIALLVSFASISAQASLNNRVQVRNQGNVDNHTGVKQVLVSLPADAVNSIYDDATLQFNATTGLFEIKRDYRDWCVELTQSSTNAPTVVATLENELGGTPVWTYTGTGVYTAELDDVFVDDKTTVDITAGNCTGLVPHAYSITDSTIVVKFFDAAGAAANAAGTFYLRARVKQ